MIKYEDKLLQAFMNIHDLNSSHDVRLMSDDNFETTGVGFYKDDSFCWGSSLAEIAFDTIIASLEKEKVAI